MVETELVSYAETFSHSCFASLIEFLFWIAEIKFSKGTCLGKKCQMSFCLSLHQHIFDTYTSKTKHMTLSTFNYIIRKCNIFGFQRV